MIRRQPARLVKAAQGARREDATRSAAERAHWERESHRSVEEGHVVLRIGRGMQAGVAEVESAPRLDE